MGRCDYASLSGAAAAATDVEDGAQRLEHRAGGNGAAPVAAAAASRRPQFVLPPRRSCWCLHLPYWLHGPTVLQLALALAVLGRLLQPDGPHRSPPRWHVAAAAAGEAPGNLNLTQLRWVLGAQAGPNETAARVPQVLLPSATATVALVLLGVLPRLRMQDHSQRGCTVQRPSSLTCPL